MDVILLVQYVYYRSLQHRHERVFVLAAGPRRHRRRPADAGGEGSHRGHRRRGPDADVATEPLLPADDEEAQASGAQRRAGPNSATAGGAAALGALTIAGLASVAVLGAGYATNLRSGAVVPESPLVLGARWVAKKGLPDPGSFAYQLGVLLGYASSVLYLLSRVSQIYRNAVRRSAEGLALTMFFVAATANTTYGASILVRAYSREEVVSSLPWLIGSLGTVALDIFILCQAAAFGKPGEEGKAPKSPLADSTGDSAADLEVRLVPGADE